MYDDLQRLTSGSQLHDSPDNCHQCRWRPGERYAYYFGRRRWEWPDPTLYYDIAGESEIRLCEQCAGRASRWDVARTWFGVIYGAVAAPCFVTALVWRHGADVRAHGWHSLNIGLVVLDAIVALALLAGSVVSATAGLLTRQQARRRLIWRHVGRMWKAQGYNTILLPEQHDRLLQQDRIRRIRHTM